MSKTYTGQPLELVVGDTSQSSNPHDDYASNFQSINDAQEANLAAQALARLRFVDRGTKTAAYSMAVSDTVTFDLTNGSINQPLPATPTSGDEAEVYVSAVSGVNVLTLTTATGAGGPFTIKYAGHGVVYRWTGTTWVERQDRKSQSSLDKLYPLVGGNTWLTEAALAQAFRIAGTPTYDATYGTLTAAAIAWPDGTTGAYATTSLDSNGAPLGFTATYGGAVTHTVTVTIPRNSSSQVSGAVTVSVA